MHLFSRTLRASSLLFAALAATVLFAPTLLAQGNPFDPQDDESGEDREVIKLGDEAAGFRAEDSSDLLVRTIAQSNPTSAAGLAKAAGLLTEVKRFDEAKKYLDSLAEIELDGEACYELNQVVGSDTFYVFARTKELQPTGREISLKVFESATAWANSDSRIDSLIEQLGEDSVYLRSEAFGKLQRVGEKAVAKILDAFADPDRKAEYAGLRGALYAFGDVASGPLLGAANSDDASVQIEAIRGLLKQDTNEATDMLMHFSLSSKSPTALRNFTSTQLAKKGINTDRDVVQSRLAARVKKFLRGGRVSSDSLMGEVTTWQWDSDTKSLVSSKTNPAIAARLRAVRIAKTLYEIDPANKQNRELYLLCQLEFNKREVGASKSIDVKAFLALVDQIDAFEVEQLLSAAIEKNLIPAATACCEVLKQIGDDALVTSVGSRPLIDAILEGDRHLQFAAMDAIIEINPKQAYRGSSYVAELAAYLASSRFTRKAAVGHIYNEISQSWATTIGSRGWDVSAANSSVDFFKVATSDPDIAVLLVSDTLTRPAHRQLIQQLRNHWKTKRMPIGLLARDEDRLIKANRYTAGIDKLLVFPISGEVGAIVGQLTQLDEMQSPWSVTSDDRFRHAARAVQWLEKATVDPELSFYQFRSHQNQLLGLLYHPEFTSSAAKILATQPTAIAQRAMLGFVSQSDLPIEARNEVADAFEVAVKRGGTMLTTKDIELQYERYNASEALPKETQKVLGRVLDIIEARRKSSRR